jgi:hypothetical protein
MDTRTTKELIAQHRRDLLAEYERSGDPVLKERIDHIDRAQGERVRFGDKESRDGPYAYSTTGLRGRLVAEQRLDYE